MQPPRLDGYDVDRLIGYGATGHVWLARESASGKQVAVKVLRATATPASMEALLDRLQCEAAVIAGLDCTHFVPIHSIREVDAQIVLVTDFVAGDSLDTLLVRRDRLSAGEVVTLIAPLADALARLHDVGLTHAAVSGSNVLIGADGRPLLTDAGLAVALGQATHDPVKDVAMLARLGCDALAVDTGPLAELLSRVAAEDAGARTTACELAAGVLEAGPAAPIRANSRPVRRPSDPKLTPKLTSKPARPAPALRPARPQRSTAQISRPSPVPRRALVAAAGAVVLVAGIGFADRAMAHRGQPAGPASHLTPTPRSSPSAAPVAQPVDWRTVVRRLEGARAEAFVMARPAALKAVYAPGSPALAADRTTVEALHTNKEHVRGFHPTVLAITPIRVSPTSAVLRVRDRLSAYSLISADGRVVSEGKARGPRTYLMALSRTPAGWRVVRVDQSIEASAPARSG